MNKYNVMLTIINTITGKVERIECSPFKDDNDDYVYFTVENIHDRPCYKFLIDEGYCKTTYYYEVKLWNITSCMIMED